MKTLAKIRERFLDVISCLLGKKNQTNKLLKQVWEILFTTYSEQPCRMSRANVFIVMKRLQPNGSHLTFKSTNKNQGT